MLCSRAANANSIDGEPCVSKPYHMRNQNWELSVKIANALRNIARSGQNEPENEFLISNAGLEILRLVEQYQSERHGYTTRKKIASLSLLGLIAELLDGLVTHDLGNSTESEIAQAWYRYQAKSERYENTEIKDAAHLRDQFRSDLNKGGKAALIASELKSIAIGLTLEFKLRKEPGSRFNKEFQAFSTFVDLFANVAVRGSR